MNFRFFRQRQPQKSYYFRAHQRTHENPEHAMTSPVCSSSQRASRHDISVYNEIGGGGVSCSFSWPNNFLWVSDPSTVTLSWISAGGGGEGGAVILELHAEWEEGVRTKKKRGGSYGDGHLISSQVVGCGAHVEVWKVGGAQIRPSLQ